MLGSGHQGLGAGFGGFGGAGAHFAVFPEELIRPCILAGCPPGAKVIDPFAGSGTTGVVAEQLGRDAIYFDYFTTTSGLDEKLAALYDVALVTGGDPPAPGERPYLEERLEMKHYSRRLVFDSHTTPAFAPHSLRLWPPMAAVIDALRPEWVIAENVPGLRTRGLVTVLRDLRRLGYRARTGVVRACEMGAPHPRTRLFILAHPDGQGCRPRGGVGRRAGTPVVGGARWAAEPDVDRVAHGVPGGVDRRRTLGNAVVPAVAEHIGRLVLGARHESWAA